MKENKPIFLIDHASIDYSRSEHYTNLPEPINPDSICYLTSFARQLWKEDYLLSRENNNIFMINYVLKGSISVCIDDNTYVMREGDLCFLNLTPRTTLSAYNGEAEIYFFHFLGESVKRIFRSYIKAGPPILQNFPNEVVKKFFHDSASSIKNKTDYYDRSAQLYAFLMKILSVRNREELPSYPDIVNRIIGHVYFTFPAPTPNEIAKHFGYNLIYLERIFRKHKGITLGNYLQKKRYSQACQLLTDTNMSVGEIALSVGYETPQGLLALFRKFGETTPLQWRINSRKQ